MRQYLGLGAALLLAVACSDPTSAADKTSVQSATKSAECPPDQKGNGIAVSSRYDYKDLEQANKWRDEMFPRSCAESLAELVPDLPAGFGVMPTSRPYIMNDKHVFLSFAELREPLYNDEGWPNTPQDLDMIQFEIVRFDDAEIAKVREWMATNPGDFMTTELNGHEIFLMGGMATGRRGQGDRLSGGLTAIYDKGLVVRLVHHSIYSQTGGVDVSPLVETVMGDILARAERQGY